MNILSVDDVPLVRKVVRGAVEALGGTLYEASDGLEALSFLKTGQADISLIILDWNMPKMNGYEFLTKIKSMDRFKQIPVIMTTTENEQDKIIKAIQAGASHYIVKPFKQEHLVKKIQEFTNPYATVSPRFSSAIRDAVAKWDNSSITFTAGNLPDKFPETTYYGQFLFTGKKNGLAFIHLTKEAAKSLAALQASISVEEVDEKNLASSVSAFVKEIVSNIKRLSEPFNDLDLPFTFTGQTNGEAISLQYNKDLVKTNRVKSEQLEFFVATIMS